MSGHPSEDQNVHQIASPKKRNSFVGVPIIFRYRAHARMSCRGSSNGTAARALRVGYLGTSATIASLWMEKEIGGFAKEGLDVEVLSISSSLEVPVLIANELHGVQMSAAPGSDGSLWPLSRGFHGILNFLPESIPEAQRAMPSQFFDDRVVRQVNANR